MGMAVKPAFAVLVHQLRERTMQLPEIRPILPPLLWGGFFAFRDAAPSEKRSLRPVNIRLFILEQVSSGKDGQYPV